MCIRDRTTTIKKECYVANFVTSFITAVQNKESNFNLSNSRLRLVSGTTNPKLAEEIASYLGIENVPLISKRFADGELYVQIQQSIRGCDVFLIQPTCAPVNDSLMELMIMVDACKRASARQITAVIPYFGYARADRKTSGRESITCLLYTSPSPRDATLSRMPSSA